MERPTSPNVLADSMALQLGMVWEQMKAPLIIPLLKLGLIICLIMSLMLFVERVYMGIVIFFVKFFGRNPDKRYKWQPIKDDVELGSSAYPTVLVQIPMFNEKEVAFLPLLLMHFLASIDIMNLVKFVVHVHAGLPALHWCCMRAFMAI